MARIHAGRLIGTALGIPFPTALAAAVLATGAAVPARAADYFMKFSTPTINELQHTFMKRYEEDLEERTDGAIDVQLYPASQLGPISSVLEGLQLGTIEASITPAELYVGVDPRFQIPAVPALFGTMRDARETLDDPSEQGGTITPLSDEDREEAEAAVAQVTEGFLERHPELRETYDLLANAGQD